MTEQALRNFARSEKAIIESSYKDETGKSNPMYPSNSRPRQETRAKDFQA